MNALLAFWRENPCSADRENPLSFSRKDWCSDSSTLLILAVVLLLYSPTFTVFCAYKLIFTVLRVYYNTSEFVYL